jgi:hypothetical protein
MHSHRIHLLALAAAAGGLALPAQDLLGVTWTGTTVLVDSYTGAVTPLGTGLFGQNALARAPNGTFWSTWRNGSSYGFSTIDPITGAATQGPFGVDIRGLTIGPGSSLYGIREGGVADDLLVQVTVPGGFVTNIGSTGSSSIQGLAMHQGVLYAWDVFVGLMVVDPTTGAATDPFPSVSGPAYQQSLCSHPDGRLLLGGGDSNGTDQLFVVDPATGVASLIGNMVGAVDVRGLEPLGGYAQPIGQGCDGAFGPVGLTVTGRIQPGGSFSSVSTNHAPNAFGIAVVGLSTTSYQGTSLPLLLDPLLGTSNCWLRTSIDASATVFAGAGSPATMQYGFAIPAWASGIVFNVQHACFEPVPGGISWSNAASLHVE